MFVWPTISCVAIFPQVIIKIDIFLRNIHPIVCGRLEESCYMQSVHTWGKHLRENWKWSLRSLGATPTEQQRRHPGIPSSVSQAKHLRATKTMAPWSRFKPDMMKKNDTNSWSPGQGSLVLLLYFPMYNNNQSVSAEFEFTNSVCGFSI